MASSAAYVSHIVFRVRAQLYGAGGGYGAYNDPVTVDHNDATAVSAAEQAVQSPDAQVAVLYPCVVLARARDELRGTGWSSHSPLLQPAKPSHSNLPLFADIFKMCA